MAVALSYEFLTERADQAAKDAACAELDNVRERALRSEAAWRSMASQALKAQRSRELAQHERDLAQAGPALD